jgi:S-adenosylmethionine hydrolase
MKILTLTTDFGTEDGNVGVMKGIIWGIAPELQIADLSHQVAPQNIRQAAFILARQVFYFPAGTVHVVVVDPGVGTSRRPIAARIGTQLFVGPDNGVFSPLYLRGEKEDWPVEIVHTNRPEFWREEVSHIFHGRDIFSPVGAHLAAGKELSQIGELIHDPVRIAWVKPQRQENTLVGEVIHIDHFGNLFVNVTEEHLSGLEVIAVQLGDYRLSGMANTFGDKAPGDLIALYSSTKELLIAQVNGNAAKTMHAKIGDIVEVLVNTAD